MLKEERKGEETKIGEERKINGKTREKKIIQMKRKAYKNNISRTENIHRGKLSRKEKEKPTKRQSDRYTDRKKEEAVHDKG